MLQILTQMSRIIVQKPEVVESLVVSLETCAFVR